jgi:hypothetical protein
MAARFAVVTEEEIARIKEDSIPKKPKQFASDLYLIYKLSPSARVCISDTDRLLMFYLVL